MEQINFALFFGHLAVYLFVWVFAITAQGASTAWMSDYYGDDTARAAGRVSFSPFVQSDLLGTIILPTVSFLVGWLSPGIPFIAWGKRVPINSEKWRNPKAAGAMVTLAATFANFLIAVASFALLKILFVAGLTDADGFLMAVLRKNDAQLVSWLAPVQLMLWYSLAVNVALTVFSLLPIPPFSGGAVLFSLLPDSFKPVKDFFNKFGLLIAILLIYFVAIDYIFLPLLNFSIGLLIN